ncbi:MAG: DUF262 domain-containing protein [Bacteroidia bacterium]|nr:DUF262 domain-containing protein [Bacteroidia bacterium]MBP9724809.1 DUF262 domain-containing protein [Bacteroidia bacterium]
MQDENYNIVNEPQVEYEDIDTGVLMERPFNPAQIDISTKNPTIDLLVKRLQTSPPEIDLYPDFQRKDDLWDAGKQSRLIESLLIKFPLPAFYFDGTDNNKWLVVDGLQRLSAIRNFMINKSLKLTSLEFLKKLEGDGFDDLPRNLQRQIEETQVTAYIINPGTPDEVKFNIFRRVNTGGLIMEPQEIRHAMNQGAPAVYVKELAQTPEFIEATQRALSPNRMLDREFVTRFISFYMNDYKTYTPDLDTFMNSSMSAIRKLSDSDKEKMKKDFISAMSLSKEIFNNWAFRKSDKYPEKRKPINKALFEVWSVTLAKLDDEQREIIKVKKEILFNKSISLVKEDSTFFNSITTSTGNKSSVAYRFSSIERIIQETLEA